MESRFLNKPLLYVYQLITFFILLDKESFRIFILPNFRKPAQKVSSGKILVMEVPYSQFYIPCLTAAACLSSAC